jgi:hypothetical protein
VVGEVEGDERSELVWRMKRGKLSFYNGGARPWAAVRSTMARGLRRARGVGEGGVLFSVSVRSSWRQRRGWAVPNLVGRVRASARQWRDFASSPATAGAGRRQEVVWRVHGAVAKLRAEEGVRGWRDASRRRVP